MIHSYTELQKLKTTLFRLEKFVDQVVDDYHLANSRTLSNWILNEMKLDYNSIATRCLFIEELAQIKAIHPEFEKVDEPFHLMLKNSILLQKYILSTVDFWDHFKQHFTKIDGEMFDDLEIKLKNVVYSGLLADMYFEQYREVQRENLFGHSE